MSQKYWLWSLTIDLPYFRSALETLCFGFATFHYSWNICLVFPLFLVLLKDATKVWLSKPPHGKLLLEIQSMLWCIKKLWFQHFWDIFRWRVVHSGRHSHSSRWDWSRLSASRSFNHQSLCSNLQEYWITLQEIQFCKIPCLLTL